jgi:Domain of Unknown Function (DUF928)
MRVQFCFAPLLAVVLVPSSQGVAQVTASPTPNLTPTVSTMASPTSSAARSSTAVSTKLFYKPPGAAGNIPARVSGGARGGGVDTVLIALVPNHIALTTQAQPSLFWFQSKPAKAKFELTVVEPKKPKPLVSLTAPQADKAGIHRVKLAKYKVELQPDVAYEWSVAIVPDAENRSRDVIAKGVIKRISPPAALATGVGQMSDVERAAAYAQAGIWYDAFESVSNAIEANPNDASLHAQRASLLQQVGLSEAASADKKR